MPVPFRDESAEAGRLLKPVPRQIFRGNGHEVELVLKLREFADHRAQQRRVVDGGRTNPKHFQVENFAGTRFQCKTGVASVPTQTQFPCFNNQVSTKRSCRV